MAILKVIFIFFVGKFAVNVMTAVSTVIQTLYTYLQSKCLLHEFADWLFNEYYTCELYCWKIYKYYHCYKL